MTREEAIKELKLFKESAIPWDVPILLTAIDMAIEALQTPPISQRSMYQAGYRQAQEDRPRGEWVDSRGKPMRLYETYSANCSACGEWSEYLTEYCPHCGADMRGGEDK